MFLMASGGPHPLMFWWIIALVAAYFWLHVFAIKHDRALNETPGWIIWVWAVNFFLAFAASAVLICTAAMSIVVSLSG